MSELNIELFTEDFAQQNFITAIINRLAGDVQVGVIISPRSTRGGHGKAISEYKLYQKILKKQLYKIPDIIIVVIDANCSSINPKYKEIKNNTADEFKDITVIGCPNPHIEKWYLADPDTLHALLGVRPSKATRKCERDYYKRALKNVITDGGHITTLGGVEFAEEIVGEMDLHKAGKNDRALGRFIDDLHSRLKLRARQIPQ